MTRSEVAALYREDKAAAMKKDLVEPQKTHKKLVEDDELSVAQGYAIVYTFQENATTTLANRVDGSIAGSELHECLADCVDAVGASRAPAGGVTDRTALMASRQ